MDLQGVGNRRSIDLTCCARSDLDQAEALTDEQLECLRLVDRHLSSKEIARRIGISPSAVDKRLERAVRMLGASSRFDAARRVFANGETFGDMAPGAFALSEPEGAVVLPTAVPQPAASSPITAIRLPTSKLSRLLIVVGMILGLSVACLVSLSVAERLSQLWGSEKPIWFRSSH